MVGGSTSLLKGANVFFFFLVTPPLPHNSTDYGAQVTALPARDIWQGRFLQVLKLACARYYLAQSGFEPGLSR